MPDDTDAVVAVLREMAREEMPGVPFSADRARASVERCMASGAVILACDGRRVVGISGATLETPELSDRKWLMVPWLYVRATHRHEPYMREMLGAVRATAQHLGVAACFRVEGGGKGKVGLLRREFGDAAGCTFVTG